MTLANMNDIARLKECIAGLEARLLALEEKLQAALQQLQEQIEQKADHRYGRGPVLWCNSCGNPTYSLINHECPRRNV